MIEKLFAELGRDLQRHEAVIELFDALLVVETCSTSRTFTWANQPIRSFLGREVAGMPVEQWMKEIVVDPVETEEFYSGFVDKGTGGQLINVLRKHDGTHWKVLWLTRSAENDNAFGYSVGVILGPA